MPQVRKLSLLFWTQYLIDWTENHVEMADNSRWDFWYHSTVFMPLPSLNPVVARCKRQRPLTSWNRDLWVKSRFSIRSISWSTVKRVEVALCAVRLWHYWLPRYTTVHLLLSYINSMEKWQRFVKPTRWSKIKRHNIGLFVASEIRTF